MDSMENTSEKEFLPINPIEELINGIRIVHGERADAIIFKALVDAQVQLVVQSPSKCTCDESVGMLCDDHQLAKLSHDLSKHVSKETHSAHSVIRHTLKSWPQFFKEILLENKTFEIRKDDRGFKVGDEILLREWNNESLVYTGYTGRQALLTITYITSVNYWVETDESDIVIMSVKLQSWYRGDDSTN